MSIRLPETIINWYKNNKRELPWRQTSDPYFIWLSEIILQQTRVAQGLPYYNRFAELFPTVYDLASAQEDLVLRTWQGLGYYSRGRNLHKAGKIIVDQYDGNFPNTSNSLKKLPGVGDYTAAAIASFAYKEKIAVLDGNVFRVLARFFGVETDILSNEGKKTFSALANEVLPGKDSDLYNQGIMEFGALQCVPKNPDCTVCPLIESCYAFNKRKITELPVKKKSKPKTNRYLNYLIIKLNGKYAFHKRDAKDIWGSLYQFPLIETAEDDYEHFLQDLQKKWPVEDVKKVGKTYKHILSHRNLWVNFYEVSLKESPKILNQTYEVYDMEEIGNLPKPVLIDKFLCEHYF